MVCDVGVTPPTLIEFVVCKENFIRLITNLVFRDDVRNNYIELGVMIVPFLNTFKCLRYVKSNIKKFNTQDAIHSYKYKISRASTNLNILDYSQVEW